MMQSKVLGIHSGRIAASRRGASLGSLLHSGQRNAPAADRGRHEAFAEPSLGAGSVEGFLTGARAAGIDIDALLLGCGIQPDFLSAPAQRITVEQWGRLVQRLCTTMNDEACGLLGVPTPVGTFLMVCRAFIHCKTVGQAMERFVNFYNLLLNGVSYRLEKDGKSVHFKVLIDAPAQVKHFAIVEFMLIGFHRLFSWLVAESIQLDSVCLSRQPPTNWAEYEQAFFQTPVQFRQGVHAVSFSRSYLDLPIIRTESDLERYVARFNTELFQRIPRTGKLSLGVRTFLLARIEQTGGLPELQDAAQYFGLHNRAFCRRLKGEGLSFQEIKSRVRRDIAIYHLSKSTVSMEKIADHAGFSETSAFIRAFRSWTNMTPLAYRKAVSVGAHSRRTA